MDRGTLAWYRCSVCGRKGAVYECTVKGERLLLCPHCAMILRAPCGLLRARGRASVRVKRVEAEDLLSRVESGLRRGRR